MLTYTCLIFVILLLAQRPLVTADDCLQNGVPTGLMARLWYSPDSDKSSDLKCSAIIINSNWLLSPASCLFDYTNPSRYQVEVIEKISPNRLVVKKIERNPSFNNELGAGYDLALINVDFRMPLENCSVHLPTLTEPNFNEKFCKLVKNANANGKDAMLKFKSENITVHLSTQNKCKYAKLVESKLVECAGASSGTVCQGETGAVVLCKSIDGLEGFYLRDMSSWGDYSTLCPSSEGYLFTKIAYYFNWINSTISIH